MKKPITAIAAFAAAAYTAFAGGNWFTGTLDEPQGGTWTIPDDGSVTTNVVGEAQWLDIDDPDGDLEFTATDRTVSSGEGEIKIDNKVKFCYSYDEVPEVPDGAKVGILVVSNNYWVLEKYTPEVEENEEEQDPYVRWVDTGISATNGVRSLTNDVQVTVTISYNAETEETRATYKFDEDTDPGADGECGYRVIDADSEFKFSTVAYSGCGQIQTEELLGNVKLADVPCAVLFDDNDEPVEGTGTNTLAGALQYAKDNENITVKLIKDIDLLGNDWTSFGFEDYSITLDGDGHTISNLGAPLFGTADTDLTIQNLTITGAKVIAGMGDANFGILAEEVSGELVLISVTVTNSTIVGDSENKAKVGALVGYVGGGAKLSSVAVVDCDISNGGHDGSVSGALIGNVGCDESTLKSIFVDQPTNALFGTSESAFSFSDAESETQVNAAGFFADEHASDDITVEAGLWSFDPSEYVPESEEIECQKYYDWWYVGRKLPMLSIVQVPHCTIIVSNLVEGVEVVSGAVFKVEGEDPVKLKVWRFPDEGYELINGCRAEDTIHMNQSQTVTAEVDVKGFTITTVAENGTIVATNINGDVVTKAPSNSTITVVATPYAGYELVGYITVTNANEEVVELGEGNVFTMPETNVTIYATFLATNVFVDLPKIEDLSVSCATNIVRWGSEIMVNFADGENYAVSGAASVKYIVQVDGSLILAEGQTEPQAIPYVAQVNEGKKYTSLAEALEEASPLTCPTVKLLTEIDDTSITVPEGVTLDLNKQAALSVTSIVNNGLIKLYDDTTAILFMAIGKGEFQAAETLVDESYNTYSFAEGMLLSIADEETETGTNTIWQVGFEGETKGAIIYAMPHVASGKSILVTNATLTLNTVLWGEDGSHPGAEIVAIDSTTMITSLKLQDGASFTALADDVTGAANIALADGLSSDDYEIKTEVLTGEDYNGYTVWYVAAKAKTYVAEINGTQYTTLGAAIAALTDGQTVTLLDDYTPADDEDLTFNVNATFDLGGKTLNTGSTYLNTQKFGVASGKAVLFKNGKIAMTSAGYTIKTSGKITTENITIIDTASEYGIFDMYDGSEVVVNAGTVISSNGDVFRSKSDDGTMTVTVNDGIISNASYAAVYTYKKNLTLNITVKGGVFYNSNTSVGFMSIPTDKGTYTVNCSFGADCAAKFNTIGGSITDYLADGYYFAKGADDYYTVAAMTAVEVPTAATGLTYTGNSLTGIVASAEYTLSGDFEATDVGVYTGIVTLVEGKYWADTEYDTTAKAIEWAIAKAAVTPEVSLSQDISEYAAGLQFPTVNVAGGYTKDTDYTIGAWDPAEITEPAAGETNAYTVTVTMTGNYSGSATATFKVFKQAAPVDPMEEVITTDLDTTGATAEQIAAAKNVLTAAFGSDQAGATAAGSYFTTVYGNTKVPVATVANAKNVDISVKYNLPLMSAETPTVTIAAEADGGFSFQIKDGDTAVSLQAAADKIQSMVLFTSSLESGFQASTPANVTVGIKVESENKTATVNFTKATDAGFMKVKLTADK